MIKKKPRKTAPNPYLNAASPDDLGPTDRIAFDIIADRPDLLPSVDRIMTAGLDDDAAHRAISLFRDSLESGSDPNRDPRVAIVNRGPTEYDGRAALTIDDDAAEVLAQVTAVLTGAAA